MRRPIHASAVIRIPPPHTQWRFASIGCGFILVGAPEGPCLYDVVEDLVWYPMDGSRLGGKTHSTQPTHVTFSTGHNSLWIHVDGNACRCTFEPDVTPYQCWKDAHQHWYILWNSDYEYLIYNQVQFIYVRVTFEDRRDKL